MNIPAVAILLFAAVLKSHQLSISPYAGNSIFGSRFATVVIIVFEIALALWLLSGWRQIVARGAAILTFVAFALVSTRKIAAGATSCGCFGFFEVPPQITLGVDLVVIVSLSLFKPLNNVASLPRGTQVVFLVSVACILYVASGVKTTSLSEVGSVLGDGLVVVDTTDWKGKHLPLFNLINGEATYMVGSWQMIIYHEGCSKCQTLIRQVDGGGFDLPTVFVEVPPLGSQNREDNLDCIWRSLSTEHEWFVAAPQVLVLENGIVKRIVGQAQ